MNASRESSRAWDSFPILELVATKWVCPAARAFSHPVVCGLISVYSFRSNAFLETHRGLLRETVRQAGDKPGLRSVGATTGYGYKGQLLIAMRCGGIYSIVHVTGMPRGLQFRTLEHDLYVGFPLQVRCGDLPYRDESVVLS